MPPDTLRDELKFAELAPEPPKCRGCSLDQKPAAWALFVKGVTAYARPVFSTMRNTGAHSRATRTDLAVAHFPRLSLVFLRDWCVFAKLGADWNAGGLSDADALLLSVRVLP